MFHADQEAFDQLCRFTRETALLTSTLSLLGWDERTGLPEAATEYRAEQMTLLAGMIHRRKTDPQVTRLLDELSESPLASDKHSDAGTIIHKLKWQHDRQLKLPTSLVEELTHIAVRGQHFWQRARAQRDYTIFQPLLEEIIRLKQQEADALGFSACRYDALLEEYEPGETTANVRRVLEGLREELVPLIQKIMGCDKTPQTDLLAQKYPLGAQRQLGREVAENIGFDFSRGRLDTTVHPFCSGIAPQDIRITTRYDECFFPTAFFGILHEAGHGIYEQGLRTNWYGLPPGETVSLGIHESQSRLWENQVGRSLPFWEYHFPLLQSYFPVALSGVSLNDFYMAINRVGPSLIRVEADEATYNLHILIRFELEQAMLDGDLGVADLPQAWNNKYQDYLGICPQNAAEGVLQDIHWSGGAIGYFPTYALGNIYSAQFFAKANQDLNGLSGQFSEGQFEPLRTWLQKNIHQAGQCYSAGELVFHVTGENLSHRFLIDHLRNKLEPLYGLS